MTKYIKKPIPVEAKQWFKMGDHPAVIQHISDISNISPKCGHCKKSFNEHGDIEAGLVCSGDWIIKDKSGYSVLGDSIFKETYEKSWIPEHPKAGKQCTHEYMSMNRCGKIACYDCGHIHLEGQDQADIDKDFIKQYQQEVKELKEEIRRLNDD